MHQGAADAAASAAKTRVSEASRLGASPEGAGPDVSEDRDPGGRGSVRECAVADERGLHS